MSQDRDNLLMHDDNPMELLERAYQKLEGADPAIRQSFMHRIIELNIGESSVSATALRQLLENRLRMPRGAPIDAHRVVELFGLLAETMAGLDDWTRLVWNQFVPTGSQGASQLPVSDAIQNYLGIADGDAVREETEEEVRESIAESVRRIQALVAALKKMPWLHAEKFAPRSVDEQIARGILGNRDANCWRKFRELCGGNEVENLAFKIETMCGVVLGKLLADPDALVSLERPAKS